MRVLFAITRGETGGAQSHVRTLIGGLAERGHTAALLVEDPSSLSATGRALGAEVIPWESIGRDIRVTADWRARREAQRAIRDFRPDVLHLHSSKAGALGVGLLRPPDGVTVFTCHHAPFGPGRRLSHRMIARPIEQFVMPRLDGIITVGARDMPLLRKLAPRVPIKLIRNAVRAHGAPSAIGRVTTTALWVARMQHPKDPFQAVDAWRHVVAEVPDARLVMCGDGPLGPALRRRIERSSARGNIDYLGLVDDLSAQHARASIFLLTSDVEGGTTIATLEAMAEGLVPVISDVGDAFLLEHAGCGVVLPRRSPKAVATAVVELFRDLDRLHAMSSRAVEFSRTSWTIDDEVNSTVDFYQALLVRR